MGHRIDVWSWKGRVGRAQYVSAGVVLFAIKYAIDAFVSWRFGQPWNPLMYVSLRLAPFARDELPAGYLPTLLAVAAPFVAAGVSLSARRLRDMGVHPFWSGLFFLPLLHYAFFAVLAAAPSKPLPAEPPEVAPYRETDFRYPTPKPQSWLIRLTPRGEGPSFLVGVLLSAAVGIGSFLLARAMDSLGIGLFLGVPFGMGFITAFCVGYGGRVSLARAVLYALVTQLVALVVLLAFAWEGVACIVMALPIFTALTALGACVGYACADLPRSSGAMLSSLVLVPLLVAVDGRQRPEPVSLSVVSTVVIHAPPDVVWRNVVSFPPIDAPPESIFAIVAMPIEAKIDGSEPGATRRCIFTNGEFVEPITTWRAPQELSFRVQEQPGKLDRYLDVTAGQFLLIDNHDGTTTLQGTTWYRLKMAPTAYWKLWSDLFLHRIHLRVLRHIQRLSESPDVALGPPAQMPEWMKTASHTCSCTTKDDPLKRP